MWSSSCSHAVRDLKSERLSLNTYAKKKLKKKGLSMHKQMTREKMAVNESLSMAPVVSDWLTSQQHE